MAGFTTWTCNTPTAEWARRHQLNSYLLLSPTPYFSGHRIGVDGYNWLRTLGIREIYVSFSKILLWHPNLYFVTIVQVMHLSDYPRMKPYTNSRFCSCSLLTRDSHLRSLILTVSLSLTLLTYNLHISLPVTCDVTVFLFIQQTVGGLPLSLRAKVIDSINAFRLPMLGRVATGDQAT